MDDLFRFADKIGPAKVVHVYQPAIDLKAIIVLDNTAAGPAIGGTRMALDVSVEECFRLARAMTYKNAMAGLPHGGGKSVIYGNPKSAANDKEQLIRAFAIAIREIEDYIPGPDMGTDERCMAWIKDEIGRSVGLPRELGGIPLDETGATGFGLAASIDAAREFCNLDLKGARVAVQGFGSVGKHAAHHLAEWGAIMVAAADSGGTLTNPNGIDIDALIDLKGKGGSVVDYGNGSVLEQDAIIDVECEIWIPAARPDVLRADNVDRLRTRLVAQGANIPVSSEAERRLHERGILNIPDFIANAGGVICAAVEYRKGTEKSAFEEIDEKVRRNTREVLEGSAASGEPPRKTANAVAEARIRRAASFQRFS